MKNQDHKALSAMDKGYAKLNNKWKCLICAREFNFLSQILLHIKDHSPPAAVGDKT